MIVLGHAGSHYQKGLLVQLRDSEIAGDAPAHADQRGQAGAPDRARHPVGKNAVQPLGRPGP